jgi:hypothetical protein
MQNMESLALRGMLLAAESGMADAAIMLLDDATHGLPSTPMDTGALRASGTAFVNRKLVKVNPQEVRAISRFTGEPGETPTPAFTHNEPIAANEIVGMVVFNQEYAEEVHDGGERNWTTPGSGDKYLESSVNQIPAEMADAVAGKIRRFIAVAKP